jgi:hypothetical protein
MCFDWRPNDLSKQRFRQQTCLRVIRRSGGNWTAITTDEVFPLFFPKCGYAAEFFENPKRGIDSLPAGFAFYLAAMFFGYGTAGRTHSSAQSSWLELS